MNRSQEITLGSLLDATLQPIFDWFHVRNLRQQMVNAGRDIELSESRIANSQAVISREEANVKTCQQAEALIQSQLLEMGAPWVPASKKPKKSISIEVPNKEITP